MSSTCVNGMTTGEAALTAPSHGPARRGQRRRRARRHATVLGLVAASLLAPSGMALADDVALPPLAPPARPVFYVANPAGSTPARTSTRTYAVERVRVATAGQAAAVARLDDDARLTRVEDERLHCGVRRQFVTVSVPSRASSATIIAAVNARTTSAIGDVTTSSRLAATKPGRTIVLAWQLGSGASVDRPWGAAQTVAQRFVGHG